MSFTVYPAIDVLEGRVVRLREGRREEVTVEGGDPAAAARRFAAAGAEWLHLVDLDGAFSGRPDLELLRRVVAAAGVPVQVGGGYRALADIAAALEAGAARVLLGTAALDQLAAGLPVIAAGGVASLDDLRALRGLGCEGAVAGSALWLGRFGLADAVMLSA
jgi:phosphoribosylformimino-5-aminoimidazole carboxamide ribonucleotide (ProFAR) isomerase